MNNFDLKALVGSPYYKFLRSKLIKVLDRIGIKNLLILLSIIIGITAALLAIILKLFVHNIHEILQYNFEKRYQNYLYIFYPLAGIFLTVLYIRKFRNGVLVKGLSNIVFSIYKRSGSLAQHKMYSHLITSGLTVGFGGSVGLEAPIVITGSAAGSNIARLFKLNHREKVLMLACGASAGIAAIFNCPIAGVIFSFEVLLGEVRIPAFIPLIIASATATVVSKVLYGGQLFVLVTKGWEISALPFYVLLGIICGLVSAYMINVNSHIETLFKTSKSVYRKILVGGIILGIMVFLFPPLFGEGYSSIEQLLNGHHKELLDKSLFYGLKSEWMFLLFVALIILLKIIASGVTIGAGGNGGVFAPSLFTGGVTGFFVAHFANVAGVAKLNETNFTAVGMAGVLSGVVHAPLTAIFLIAEITGGYVLFVPLMIVSASSYFIGKYFEPYSVYTKELAKKGKWSNHDRDFYILNQIKLHELIEKDFVAVKPTHTLGQLIRVISNSKRNLFPVLDEHGRLLGVILLDNIREIMFSTAYYDKVLVKDLMVLAPTVVEFNESMKDVMRKFEYFEVWNLPVIRGGKYIGFISKSRIFNLYRNHLVDESQEIF
jgi:chloride channel protein, CIC family